MNDIRERRRDAVEACIARFVGKPYDPGVRDCIKLGSHNLHKMGRGVSLLKGVRYSTEAGGLKALRRLGFADLLEAVDATGLVRIAPASALAADLVALRTDAPGFGCGIAVYAGNGKVVTFDAGFGVVGALNEAPLTAWRVI